MQSENGDWNEGIATWEDEEDQRLGYGAKSEPAADCQDVSEEVLQAFVKMDRW